MNRMHESSGIFWQIMGLEKGGENHSECIEAISSKIIEENFPNLEKKMPKAYRTPNKLEQKEKCLKGTIVKTFKM